MTEFYHTLLERAGACSKTGTNEIIKLSSEAASGMLSYDAECNWRLGEKEVERFATLVRTARAAGLGAVLKTDGVVKNGLEFDSTILPPVYFYS